jgi:hypothetical protein
MSNPRLAACGVPCGLNFLNSTAAKVILVGRAQLFPAPCGFIDRSNLARIRNWSFEDDRVHHGAPQTSMGDE